MLISHGHATFLPMYTQIFSAHQGHWPCPITLKVVEVLLLKLWWLCLAGNTELLWRQGIQGREVTLSNSQDSQEAGQ